MGPMPPIGSPFLRGVLSRNREIRAAGLSGKVAKTWDCGPGAQNAMPNIIITITTTTNAPNSRFYIAILQHILRNKLLRKVPPNPFVYRIKLSTTSIARCAPHTRWSTVAAMQGSQPDTTASISCKGLN